LRVTQKPRFSRENTHAFRPTRGGRRTVDRQVGIPPARPVRARDDRCMTSTPAFRIHPVSADALEAARSTGRDVSGAPVQHLLAEGGEPLRCCLRDARPGEACVLFGYEPHLPGAASPYREIGAVFAHAARCDGPASTVGYPADWRGRAQVVQRHRHRHRLTRGYRASAIPAARPEKMQPPRKVPSSAL
jgi:hypothetical protein